MENQLAIIITPLLAIMEDQVQGLKAKGIKAEHLGSNRRKEWPNILKKIEEGVTNVLYLSPEWYGKIQDTFKRIVQKRKVSLFGIDEAHTISTWGCTFRPDFLLLNKLMQEFSHIPIVAATATATAAVQEKIQETLQLKDPTVTKVSINRSNIFIRREERTVSNLEHVMATIPNNCQLATIVYLQTIREVEELHEALAEKNIRSLKYHAKMQNKDKIKSHQEFLQNKSSLLVATIAYGMGIDKKDIRRIIHLGAPGSISNYVQEIGRAGRDGHQSIVTLFYSNNDFNIHR